jgi:hypothetical protein
MWVCDGPNGVFADEAAEAVRCRIDWKYCPLRVDYVKATITAQIRAHECLSPA